MQALAFSYQVDITTVHNVIKETCQAVWEILSPIYVKAPFYKEEWESISSDFMDIWNFPNCLGALDGKQINIQVPKISGNLHCDNKKKGSIVLMAACDANYCFTLFDIGAYGPCSDGGVFRNSIFGKFSETGNFDIPAPSILQGTKITCPYAFAADEAFPLRECILRPYPGKNLNRTKKCFNYRLSRARKTIENTFGILSARWRILRQDIVATVETVEEIILATICLHNFLRIEETKIPDNMKSYCPLGFIDTDDNNNDDWRTENNELPSVGRLSANNARRELYLHRDMLAEYFMSLNGELPEQYEHID